MLAKVGCLAVFQVAGADARELTWELGRQLTSKDDLVGQPRHHCCVSPSVGIDTLPAFSVTGRKPAFGDLELPARIRGEAESYLPRRRRLRPSLERKRGLEQIIAEHARTEETQGQAEMSEVPMTKSKPGRTRSKRKP